MKKKIIDIRFNFLLLLIFVIGVILIYSTYAWFASTMDVTISNFNIKVDTETGLSISLDAINWGDSVDISKDSLITNLSPIYGSHTNRWSDSLTSVSTVGLNSYYDSKFTVFENQASYISKTHRVNRDLLETVRTVEDKPEVNSKYLAFDVFLRNNSNSPYSDNLYISNGNEIFKATSEDDEMIIDALRLGIVFMGSVNKHTNPVTVQNMGCNPRCTQLIYEPSITHTDETRKFLEQYNINVDEVNKFPTYAVVREGRGINLWSGVHGSDHDFDEGTFSYQDTVSSINGPIYQIPDGILKLRIYIWVEGQDIDIIKYYSEGFKLQVAIDFEKDFAGYQQ